MIVVDPGLFYAYSAEKRVIKESSTFLNLKIEINNRLCNSPNTSLKLAEPVKTWPVRTFSLWYRII